MNSSANVSTFYSTLSSVICICRYQLRRIRFTLSVVLPLFLLAIPSNAVAQLSDGAVVAIRTSSRYMTANDNSVYESSITNLWANSLWVVSMNGDNEYSFRNVGNSKYLSCNKSGSDYSIVMSEIPLYWSYDGVNQYLSYDYKNTGNLKTQYVQYEYNFKLTENRSAASAISFDIANLSLTVSPAQLNCAISGSSECVTVTSIAQVQNQTISLPFNYSTSNSSFFSPWISGDQLCAYVAANNGAPKNAIVAITNEVGLTTELTVLQSTSAFQHQKGNSGRDLMANGMQGVHTERKVIYMPLGASKSLELFETKFSYSRWYQYDTDQNVSVGSIGVAGTQLNGNMGICNLSASNATYVAPSSMPNGKNVNSDVITEVACDLSYYKDYTRTNNVVSVEPTLSQRVIYEIRPAIQMSDKLNKCQNNNGNVNGTYLEEYTIIAPVGQKIRFGPAYEYQGANNNYYISDVKLATGYQWYENGKKVSFTLENNRVVNTSHSVAETVIYTLVVGGRGIAKFTIIYKDINEIGPKVDGVISDSILQADYKYVTGLNFNGNENTPLQWDESGYGFFYWEWLNNSAKRTYGGVYWGEYGFMTVTDGTHSFLSQGVRDRSYYKSNGQDTQGKFLYVDASSKPGVVASLRFSDGSLCPGTRMYVSAWVNNLGTGTNPNLNFVVVGVNADKSEDDIATYNTGDLSHDNGHRGLWKHIFFEIMMPNIDYVDYRVRIVNNAQNASGNDFAIDDICIYMQVPSLMIYQAGVACSADENEKVDEVIMIRMDPIGFDFPNNWSSEVIYYQLNDDKGVTLDLNYEGTTNVKYGKVNFTNGTLPRAYNVYAPANGKTGLELYAEQRNLYLVGQAANPGNIFITVEPNEEGENREIYYLLHENNGEFLAASTYHCVIGLDPDVFTESFASCGMTSSFTMQPNARLVLNGELMHGMVSDDLCANQINTIGMRLYGANGDLNQVFSGNCRYDWLNGNKKAYEAGGRYEDFDYNVIIQAIESLREVYPVGNNLNDVVPSDIISAAQIDLLKQLIARGMLELNQSDISRRLLPGENFFTVLPVVASALTDDGRQIQVCQRPFTITLMVGESTQSFNIGVGSEVGVPAMVKASPRILRYYADDLNSKPLQVPVCDMVGLTLKDLQTNSSACHVYLLGSTSDKSAPLETVLIYSSVSFVEIDGQVVMSLNKLYDGFKYQSGHKYDFVVILPLSAGESCASGGYFTVIANPKQVMWTPQGNSNSWHRDANWTMIDAFGNIDYSGGGYVPGVKTDVLIPNHADMPVLQKSSTIDSQTALVLADDSQEYIEWDINFVANSCGNIHVAAHAQFGNQQWLTYDNAWVDVPIATGKWNLFAPPFLDLVTGDMHIPASGVYKNPLFGPVDNADNRGIYRFFTSFFNSESYTTDRYGEHTSVTASTWTAPFNALSQKIVSGHGYSIWPSRTNGADSVIVRLPKSEERYYYYGSYGEQTSLYEDIKRPTGGHKLAGSNGEPVYADFDLRHEDISSHLVANPFLSDLDIDAFMDDPYNLSTVSQHFSLFVGESRNQVVYNRALKIATEGEYVDKIAPMSSFLVHINPAATRPQLRVDPSMLQCNKKSSRMRAPSANHYPQLRLTAVRNGVRSTCLVVQVPESDATYHSAEDSKLTMLSGEMTPAAIYTHDHSVGMAINVLPSLEMVPLGFVVQDEEATQSLIITFNGVDEFNGDLYLVDLKDNSRTLITEGTKISLPELVESEKRYILYRVPQETTWSEDVVNEHKVTVHQPINGQVVITSIEEMLKLRIYSITGQILNERNLGDSYMETISLESGIYLFDIETVTGKSCQKVIVQ